MVSWCKMLSFSRGEAGVPIAFTKLKNTSKPKLIYYHDIVIDQDNIDRYNQRIWEHPCYNISTILPKETMRNLAYGYNMTANDVNKMYKLLRKPRMVKYLDRDEAVIYDRCIEFLKDNCIKEIHLNTPVYPIPKFSETEIQRTCALFCGPAGAGKSYKTADYCKIYKKLFPNNRIIIFSEVQDDPAYADLGALYVDLDKSLVDNPVDIDELKDSMVIFDDTDTIEIKKVADAVQSIKSRVLQNGRHKNISCCVTAHILRGGNQTKKQLIESDHVFLFPKSGSSYQIESFLRSHCGLGPKGIKRFLNLPTRCAMISKSIPRFVTYESGVYLL